MTNKLPPGMNSEEVWENLSKVASFQKISDFMEDDDVTNILAQVVKVIEKPNIPPGTAAILVVYLTAVALKFRAMSRDFMYLSKDANEAAKRKGFYLSLADSIMDLVNSLKFLAKPQ